jgi:small subunit ribosomal protein S16
MLTIRLRRGGARGNPMYRVVVSDSRKTPGADYVEQVGIYNPHSDPPELKIDLAKVEEWQGKGAGVSETVRSLIKRAQRQQPTT